MREGILIGLLTFAAFGAGMTVIGLVFDVIFDRLTKPGMPPQMKEAAQGRPRFVIQPSHHEG